MNNGYSTTRFDMRFQIYFDNLSSANKHTYGTSEFNHFVPLFLIKILIRMCKKLFKMYSCSSDHMLLLSKYTHLSVWKIIENGEPLGEQCMRYITRFITIKNRMRISHLSNGLEFNFIYDFEHLLIYTHDNEFVCFY